MVKSDTKERIKRIQSHLGVPADGVIGPTTLTALENRLFAEQEQEAAVESVSLTVSREGLELMVRHEISSAAYIGSSSRIPPALAGVPALPSASVMTWDTTA